MINSAHGRIRSYDRAGRVVSNYRGRDSTDWAISRSLPEGNNIAILVAEIYMPQTHYPSITRLQLYNFNSS